MKAIEDAIARLEAERTLVNARIDAKIEAFREAILMQDGSPPTETPSPAPQHTRAPIRRQRRGNLKQTVLDLAKEAGDRGLTTERCLTMAKDRGIDLLRDSVSSLLSRLKSDDILFFDGQVYRLKQYAGPRQAA